jgi:hypothetical protein
MHTQQVRHVDAPDEAHQQPFAHGAAPRSAADPSPVGEIGRGPNAQAHAHALRPRAGLYSQKSFDICSRSLLTYAVGLF